MKIIPPLTDEQKRARDRALNPEQVKCGECGMTWREGQALLMNCTNRYCPVAPPRPTMSDHDSLKWRNQDLRQRRQQADDLPYSTPCSQCRGTGLSHGAICDLCNGRGGSR